MEVRRFYPRLFPLPIRPIIYAVLQYQTVCGVFPINEVVARTGKFTMRAQVGIWEPTGVARGLRIVVNLTQLVRTLKFVVEAIRTYRRADFMGPVLTPITLMRRTGVILTSPQILNVTIGRVVCTNGANDGAVRICGVWEEVLSLGY